MKDETTIENYEPTREHWTPYEPWMRDVLADDARTSRIDGGEEVRMKWERRLTLGRPLEGVKIHPDDVPEQPTEDDPDEALAKALKAEYGKAQWWLDVARAAREHIEAEREEGGYNIRRAERERRYREEAEADLADMTRQRDKCATQAEKAEADAEHWRAEFNQADERIVGLTRERDGWRRIAGQREDGRDRLHRQAVANAEAADEWRARHAALREDVVEVARRNGPTIADRLVADRVDGILNRDDKRGERG